MVDSDDWLRCRHIKGSRLTTVRERRCWWWRAGGEEVRTAIFP
jgi:hypothetical protein